MLADVISGHKSRNPQAAMALQERVGTRHRNDNPNVDPGRDFDVGGKHLESTRDR